MQQFNLLKNSPEQIKKELEKEFFNWIEIECKEFLNQFPILDEIVLNFNLECTWKETDWYSYTEFQVNYKFNHFSLEEQNILKEEFGDFYINNKFNEFDFSDYINEVQIDLVDSVIYSETIENFENKLQELNMLISFLCFKNLELKYKR